MPEETSRFNVSDLDRKTSFLVQRVRSIGDTVEQCNIKELSLARQEKEIDKNEELYTRSKELYKAVIDEVYRRSLGEIEEVLNMALQYIFFDKNYTAKIEISDYKSKTIHIYKYDNDYSPPRVMDMRDGVGNGVRTVASFVLLSYYLISQNRMPFIFADEAYSGISEAYVDRFFSFVSSLCEKKGLRFALITHDQRYLLYGDKQYSVSEGVVREITGMDKK